MKKVTMIIDRPLGTSHPQHPDLIYPVNYGYIPGVMAADGEEQDAYLLGVEDSVTLFTGWVIAIVHRKDDIEDKWVVVPDGVYLTKEEIRKAVIFQEQYFDYEIQMEPGQEENRLPYLPDQREKSATIGGDILILQNEIIIKDHGK